MPEYKIGVCRVCYLLDKDKSLKPVFFCNFCKAWICDKCKKRYDRRALASIIDKLSKYK